MRSARGLCGGVSLNSQSSRQTKSGRRTNASEAAWPLQRVGRYTSSRSNMTIPLVTAIDHRRGIVFIKWLGSHKGYDRSM
jgi:hypothetical protein